MEDELDIPTYQDSDEQDFADFWQWMNYYRWILNFFLVGMPYFVVACILNAYNIWFNIVLNDWWAEGNVYLMGNSLFSVLLTQISLIVVFEIPIFLENIKPLRMFAFLSGIVYNFIYALFVLETHRMFQLEEFTNFDILIVFFMTYNLVMNAGNFILSNAIVLKEISLEWVQLGNDAVGVEGDYSLGLVEFYMFWRGVGWILNPLNWFDLIYYAIKGY